MPHQVQSTNAKHKSPHFWALIVCCLAAEPQLAAITHASLDSCLMHCELSPDVAAHEALNRIPCIGVQVLKPSWQIVSLHIWTRHSHMYFKTTAAAAIVMLFVQTQYHDYMPVCLHDLLQHDCKQRKQLSWKDVSAITCLESQACALFPIYTCTELHA